MLRKILGSFVMLGVVGAALSVSSDASAGLQQSSANVIVNADFSGSANGTFAGFRNNADPSAYVVFMTSTVGNIMHGELNGKQFSCAFPSSLLGAFNQAMLSRDYFSVAWNTAGTCTSLYLQNSSADGSY